MPPRGCVRVPSLPLQVLLADHPAWRGTPVAVTRDERPQSPVLALNREAREKGLTEGVRYASALSLVPGLRARGVSPARIQAARTRIAKLLASYTPDIEPCPFDPDAFWVSVEGLRSLFGDESRWIRQVSAALESEGFPANVVVGFTRFGTYALARSGSRSGVFDSPQEERSAVERSPVEALPLPPRTRAILRKLEVRTVRQFVSLPPGEMQRRLGQEAGRLQKAILSDDPLPIQPVRLEMKVPCRRRLDTPIVDRALLFPHVEELLRQEAARVQAQRSVIADLTLILRTEEGETSADLIRPAAPTLSVPVLARLIQLRLSARSFASGVEQVELRCTRARPSRKQEELFSSRGRDLAAGARAFAVIRARFGEESVSAARRSSSHIPERSFQWVPLERPVLPVSRKAESQPAAVRRIFFTPNQLPAPAPSRGDAGGLLVSAGWWGETEADRPVSRAYRFQETREGIAWIYQDLLTGAAWTQAVVD